MGLPHSGDLADYVLFSKSERQWAMLPQVLVDHSVLGFWRFKDDGIFFANGTGYLSFFNEYMRRAEPFAIKVEEISRRSVSFLETTVQICPSGRVLTLPYVKESSLLMPLSSVSGHPEHTHRSWPEAVCRRLEALTHDLRGKTWVRSTLAKRFRDHDCNTSALLVEDGGKSATRPRKQDRDGNVRDLWIAIPYHPSWFHQISRVVLTLNRDLGLKGVYRSAQSGEAPRVRIAWCNDSGNHARLLDSVCRSHAEKGYG